MNTELSEMDRNSRTPANGDDNARDSGKRGGGLAVLALLLALAALAICAWLWWQDMTSSGEAQQRLLDEGSRLDARVGGLALKLDQLQQELDTLKAADGGREIEELQRRMQAESQRLAEVEQSVRQQQALSRSLQGSTEAIQGRLAAAESALSRNAFPERDAAADLDVAEVDYLLRLANERLKIFSDPQAADRALGLADAHLAALDNPTFLGVRRDIAAVREALSRVDRVDAIAVAAQLDGLQDSIPSLPFADAAAATGTPRGSSGDGWWARLKDTFAGLVTIRRTAGDEVTLSLEDKDYVRQRLWLELEMAHLALMRRDEPGFRSALERAVDTLDQWFDPTDDGLQSVRAQLQELATLPLQGELPDITAPWNSLRLLRAPAPSTSATPDAAQAEATPPEGSADGAR